MKNAIIFSILVLTTVVIFAQKVAVISVDKNNYVYAGIENPISIAVPGVQSDQISVEVEGGDIKKIDDSRYSLMPNPKSKEAVIQVFSGKSNSKTSHGSIHFRIKQIPAPDCYLGTSNLSNNPTISKGQLHAMSILVYRNSITEFEIPVPVITKFTLSYKNEDSDFVDISISGNKIPGDVIAEISNLKEGTEVLVLDIYASYNNQTQIMSSCSFIVE